MITIILFILILSLLVFVHEFGHFSVAKWAGMKVEEFGFGFPPKLFGIKKGETLYSVNLIPLGGFVKIFGESGEERDDPRSFAGKSKRKRFLVLVAGVVMNALFAWLLLAGGFMYGLPAGLDEPLPGNPSVRDVSVQVTYVLPDSTADRAGLTMGDEVLAVNGTSSMDADRARELIGLVPSGQDLTLIVSRDGVSRDVILAPELIDDGRVVIGTQLTTVGLVSYGPIASVIQGANATINLTAATLEGFGSLLGRLFKGEGVSADLAGPVGIAAMTGDVAELGIPYLIHFTALLSINLAILNILPFPALDGGRIFFLFVEAIRRKPISEKIERSAHGLGFLLLILLVILVTYRDIAGLISG
jgi:regulator of sigma E protease